MPNRLADQASPYLLQHAGNPVDWYPWGEEAFERARTSERPLLLSIGYAACHWCHVMEHESFSDPGTAALMNSGFVCVKVDREERPDVDHIYMTAVQMLTGRGGWPLTVFLTPDGRPFYGGTYFPPEPRHGMPAFREVLRAVMDAWRTRRSDLVTHADELRDLIARSAHAEPGGPAPEGDPVQAAVVRLRSAFDPTHGGFGGAPKFPQPALLDLLLDWRIATGDAQAGSMVTHTLRAMARGGIRDHLAGGFHRYSVDARWLVPHFEKMLYDNAQLARTFMRAGLAEEAPDLQAVALETLDYVLADLTDAGGGFHCARDADSEGEEGRYYVWTEAEVDAVLGEDAPLFKRAYDVSAVGNWEGVNILHLPHDPDALARSAGMEPARLTATLASARARLLEVRSGRSQPLRDDKVLTDWSGLTVRALAEVGWRLGRPAYVTAAARAARFLLDTLRVDGRLLHAWRDGRRGEGSFLSDHAALGNGLLSLYEATLDPVWAREAATLADALLERFGDAGEALLHDTPADGEALIVRPRDLSDGALPSGNALAAELLARLGPLFGRDDWTERARSLVDAARPLADRHPLAFGHLLGVEARLSSGPLEVVLVGAPDAVAGLHRTLATRIIPGLVLAGPGLEESPLLAERGAPPGEARAWVCWHRTCSAPLPDAESLRDELDRVGLPRPSG